MRTLVICLLVSVLPSPTLASDGTQTPTQFFGYTLADDVRVPTWQQVVDYHKHLSETSDRVRFEVVAQTTGKRPMIVATVSSPANLARLEEIRQIQLKLADPRTIRPGELDDLVARGRPVSLLFSVEADQTGAWLSQIVFAHKLATSGTPEVVRWLDNTVLLFMVTMNPDALDTVHDWVEKTRGTKWEGTSAPGSTSVHGEHNRDWATFAVPELRSFLGVVKRWQPTVVHDLHTMGFQPRKGIRFFAPPYIGPLEPNVHPLIAHFQSELGMAMHGRMLERGLTGVAHSWLYDLWSPGLSYFPHHHTLKILTEASPGRMTAPTTIRRDELETQAGGLDPRIPWTNFPAVWEGGEWGNKQIMDYNLTMLDAEVEHLSANRERYLRAKHQAASDTIARQGAFLVPADQHDPSALREMLELLRFGEVEIHRAVAPFTTQGTEYAAGTYVVRLDQPFGNWAKAMLEPQRYPEVRPCPTCPIEASYDISAFSYPYAMGVRVVAAAAPIRVQMVPVTDFASPGSVEGAPGARGAYLLTPNNNAAFKAVAQLLRAKVGVARTRAETRIRGRQWPAGTFVIAQASGLDTRLAALARELGLEFVGTPQPPPAQVVQLALPRVGVYRPHIGGFRNGWGFAGLLFPEYGIPFDWVYDADLRAGNLKARFDAIFLPAYFSPQAYLEGHRPGTYPPEMTGGMGTDGVRHLGEFARAGDTVLGVDFAPAFLTQHLKLPVTVVSGAVAGSSGATAANAWRGQDEFMVPGSFLAVRAQTGQPLTYGMPGEFAGMFNRGQILEPNGEGATSIASYAAKDLLLSGMAVRADQELGGKSAVVDVRWGAGHIVLFGIRPEMRLHTRGTYKLLFNAIYEAAAQREASPSQARAQGGQ